MHKDDTIQNELKELNSVLADIPKMNVYTVPDGYFDVLSHDILLAIQEPVQEAGGGTVPAGYFEGLSDSIMAKIKTEEETSLLLKDIKEKNVYSVPVGYFDSLAGSIMAGIKAEESVLLNRVKDINVYTVPAGYFENLPAAIISRIPQPAKVIEFRKRSSFFNYAAAAAITGIIGLTSISIFEKRNTEGSSMKDVMTAANEIIKTKSFDKELSTISDDAIVNYLQESGQDVNAALVASITDDKNLPDQEDYILDDKTLDNLLSELKIGETTNN